MGVTKDQIQHGLVKFMEEVVVKGISDKPIMMVMAVLAALLKNSDKVVAVLLDNPVVCALLCQDEEGRYNLDTLFGAIRSTIDKYGTFDITIPLTKSPLRFNADDFATLKRMIEEG